MFEGSAGRRRTNAQLTKVLHVNRMFCALISEVARESQNVNLSGAISGLNLA